jgi:hypothetical protein
VGHDRHAELHRGTVRPFVANLSGSAREQTGNVTFHDGATVATGAGQLHLVRRPSTVQPGLIEYRENLLGAEMRGDGRDHLGDADTENATLVQRLTEDGVVDAEIPGQRMDGWPLWPAESFDGLVDVVEQGHHRAGIARMAHGCTGGKDQAAGRLREDAGLPTKLGRAIPLPFDERSNGGIEGIDDCMVVQPFALDQSSRVCAARLDAPLAPRSGHVPSAPE